MGRLWEHSVLKIADHRGKRRGMEGERVLADNRGLWPVKMYSIWFVPQSGGQCCQHFNIF